MDVKSFITLAPDVPQCISLQTIVWFFFLFLFLLSSFVLCLPLHYEVDASVWKWPVLMGESWDGEEGMMLLTMIWSAFIRFGRIH